ncbi:hypothetical protein GCM10022226_30760 [Sphaerisporangium flaviroseum]|uniref:Thioesterase domain-containing protein n=2 Tax=Sphaerisporangium flaviroseum TaxID=509199 RepID=A0ABP7I493_9ACTN
MLDSPWFLSAGTRSAPAARVFCFPPAGGNPRTFLGWQPDMGADAEIVAVCVPGRAHRCEEPSPATVGELADGAAAAIAAHAGLPVYLFGHSLGGLLAFEVARRLRGLPALRHLVVSGCAAPRLNPSDYIVWSNTNHGRAFAVEAASFLGLSAEFAAADEEVQDLLLADMREDVRLLAEYRYRPQAPLSVGVSLICGRDDPHVDGPGLTAWREECETVPECHWTEGDHFYLDKRPTAVTDVLRPLVLGGTGGAAPSQQHVEVI